jgi:hypothetical protein
MFALSQVYISLLLTRTEQVKPAPDVKPIQAKKNYPNGCIDVKRAAMKQIEILQSLSLVLQRGYTAVGLRRSEFWGGQAT